MNVILFGATGMIGQGVLRECLRDDSIERVLVIGRSPVRQEHPKLVEVLQSDPPTCPPSVSNSPTTTPASSAWASPPSG